MSRRSKESKPARGPGRGFFALSVVLAAVSGLVTGVEAGLLLSPEPPARHAGAAGGTTADRAHGLLPGLHAPMTILLMATDVDYTVKNGKRVMGLRGRTDSMLLARLDPATDEIRVVSIPRDTRVAIGDRGLAKINAANPYGGPQLAAQAVADLLGVTVDRYLLVNTTAVKQLVDALGGVQLYVPKAMHYDDWAGGLHIHLQPGWNRLDGQAAHDFLRFRHDAAGDIGRIQRQQKFLEALASQYMTPANLLKTPALLQLASEHLETDMAPEELVRLVAWGKDLTPASVQMTMLPGTDAYVDGGWYWIPDERGLARVTETFLAGAPAPGPQAAFRYRVAIRDGVGDGTALGALKRTVAGAGYGHVAIESRQPALDLGVTEIIAQQADVEGARALAETLGVGRVVVAATGDRTSDFTIVMGRDWLERQARQAQAP